jgi:hypothetical protein
MKPRSRTTITLVIVDRKCSMVLELKFTRSTKIVDSSKMLASYESPK